MTLKSTLVTLKFTISEKLALTGALIMNVAPCTFKNMILCFKPMILLHCKLLHEWYGYLHTKLFDNGTKRIFSMINPTTKVLFS